MGPSGENLFVDRDRNLIGPADEERKPIKLQFLQLFLTSRLQSDSYRRLGLERTWKAELNDRPGVISGIGQLQWPHTHLMSGPELTRSFTTLAPQGGASLQQKTLFGTRVTRVGFEMDDAHRRNRAQIMGINRLEQGLREARKFRIQLQMNAGG